MAEHSVLSNLQMPQKKKNSRSKNPKGGSSKDVVSLQYGGWVNNVVAPALVKLYLESKALPPKDHRA